MVAGSRPTAAQCPSSTFTLALYASGGTFTAFHSSAYFATNRNVRFSPLPPIRIGGLPLAGFFAQGELGPVGGKNFLHGFTASLGLFGPPEA